MQQLDGKPAPRVASKAGRPDAWARDDEWGRDILGPADADHVRGDPRTNECGNTGGSAATTPGTTEAVARESARIEGVA